MELVQGKVVVTGAAGFIGRALVHALARRADVEQIVAFVREPAAFADAKVQPVVGDLALPGAAARLVDPDVGTVFHLASLVSGGAERDYALGARINLDAPRELLDAAAAGGRVPRIVYASSIAVYGSAPDGDALNVTDATPPAPRLSYGTHKLIVELLLNDLSRRGVVDGRSVRLPTVMVRDTAANTAVSGWVSALVREPLAGRDHACPVAPATQMACLSVGKAVDALLHAATLPAAAFGADRTVLLDGLPASAAEIVAALERQAGDRPRGRVRFAPDPQLQALMDTLPRSTRSARGAALGFPRNADIDEIVAEYIATL